MAQSVGIQSRRGQAELATAKPMIWPDGSGVVISAAPAIALEDKAMGWRDINMNRRKPQKRFAVVPNEEGLDVRVAVLRKAAQRAVASAVSQSDGNGEALRQPAVMAFAAGYLAGFARHQGLQHGVDAEHDMPQLIAMLGHEAPAGLQPALAALAFSPRSADFARARLAAADHHADAGYLTGQFESLCGSRKLLGLAAEVWGKPDAAPRYLTACDTAADRMQTHEPTASLRFDQAERTVISAAFSPSAE
jgi:hypothetical protein